nr:hypothetical protein [uncultured Halomonas sp.]
MLVLENLTDEHFGSYSWMWVAEKYDKSASDFLQYAIEDLEDGCTSRNLINAISNTKKALHIRMNELSEGFGIGKSNACFPEVFVCLKNCGFVAPKVLDRINKLRNKVEHQYITPALEDVEIYIDVVQLFIASTRKWMENCVVNIKIEKGVLDDSGEFYLSEIEFEWTKGEIELHFRSLKGNDRKVEIINKSDTRYFKIISMALQNDH